MRLITEVNDNIDVLVISEENDPQKNYYISGVFMQSEKKNRNGRVYPKDTLLKEVNRYNEEIVKNNRAMGELGHPEGPSVNLERVSHIIKELYVAGNDVYGKAKILNTPYGQIVKNLIDEGAKLGVSSRGMGSLRSEKDGTNIVQEDFLLAAVDIVADPSAPDAFVNGVMEGKEWVWNNGVLQPVEIEKMKKKITRTEKRMLEEAKIKMFEYFISRL